MRLSLPALSVWVLLCIPGAASAQAPDAWWTGPMLANSAGTLPRGHVLAEPYFYDVASGRSNSYGTRSYLLYGASNRLTIGLIPVLGLRATHGRAGASGVDVGDLTLIAQYELTRAREGGRVPTTALMIQETLPTGQYDRLSARSGDGIGSGSYTTTAGLNLQTSVRGPRGHALRVRVNLSGTLSGRARVDGVSVFGTPEAFRGTASPGAAYFADMSVEYSLRRRFAIAADVFCSGTGRTLLTGSPPVSSLRSIHAVGVAPAIELSLTQNLGVLFGVRVIPAGAHTPGSITPAIAINFVH